MTFRGFPWDLEEFRGLPLYTGSKFQDPIFYMGYDMKLEEKLCFPILSEVQVIVYSSLPVYKGLWTWKNSKLSPSI